MLDVARHFFTKEEVMSLTDRLACYKFNRLHLHLTDDQGWRIEIKRYPLLTRRGAWRTPNKHDSVCLRRAADERDPKFLLPEKTYAANRAKSATEVTTRRTTSAR